MVGKRLSVPSAFISDVLDVQVSDARLNQLARLTASKFWKQPEDEEWGQATVFMFKASGRYVYAVFPIFRGRYYAATRVRREDIPPGDERLSSEDVEVISVSVLEDDALRLALSEVTTTP